VLSAGRAATRIATALLGNAIATNLFMLGFAWQRGLVPVSEEALMRAIELNGVAVDANKRAFLWGRRAAADLDAVEALVRPAEVRAFQPQAADTLEEIVARRVAFLTGYQNARYAARYKALVDKAVQAEQAKAPGMCGFAEAVARYYFKLMAYKDEYEVARLHSDRAFLDRVRAQFEGSYKLRFHLAPPMLADKDPNTGVPRKKTYGPWMLHVFRLLAGLKGLRGTKLDIFGYTAERRLERQLIADYEATVGRLIDRLDHANHGLAVEIAGLPEHIRGYGHIKEASVARARAREAELTAGLDASAGAPAQAAE